eukprot:TRINITY_DN98927_c0_g1_i1.p1 TRINITY_DN98927_c0_g1~~TRINITY_DN98927_c0_g1_i1.p1  ORF type:complete len:115 (-),score=24.73 TRINITY_DN98927_c0_g1_i1:97-441(-)
MLRQRVKPLGALLLAAAVWLTKLTAPCNTFLTAEPATELSRPAGLRAGLGEAASRKHRVTALASSDDKEEKITFLAESDENPALTWFVYLSLAAIVFFFAGIPFLDYYTGLLNK